MVVLPTSHTLTMPRPIYYTPLLLFIILYISIYTNIFTIPSTHTFVIDAGSSGTRVHLYHDQTTNIIQSYHTTPGISSLTANDAAKQVSTLLKQFQLPKTKLELYLLATAGMRTLTPENQTITYQAIRKEIEEDSLLKQIQVQKLETISGQEEGKLAWIAANWLQKSLWANQTYGIADLGTYISPF